MKTEKLSLDLASPRALATLIQWVMEMTEAKE